MFRHEIQAYLRALAPDWLPKTLRHLKYGIAITKKRRAVLSRRASPRCATPPPHPFFAFLTPSSPSSPTHEDSLYDVILSFLESNHCCNSHRTTLFKCRLSLGGNKDDLRQGHGDNVARWKCVMVEDGRLVKLCWEEQGLTGTLPAELGALDALRDLGLWNNETGGLMPPEIGQCLSLTDVVLCANMLEGSLPPSLNCTSLKTLLIQGSHFVGAVPSTLANSPDLVHLGLCDKMFTSAVPPSLIMNDGRRV